MIKVYVSSKSKYAAWWNSLSCLHVNPEIHVVSTWINDFVNPAIISRAGCAESYIDDVKKADILLGMATSEDAKVGLTGVYLEIGVALACNVPILLLGDGWSHNKLMMQHKYIHYGAIHLVQATYSKDLISAIKQVIDKHIVMSYQ